MTHKYCSDVSVSKMPKGKLVSTLLFSSLQYNISSALLSLVECTNRYCKCDIAVNKPGGRLDKMLLFRLLNVMCEIE